MLAKIEHVAYACPRHKCLHAHVHEDTHASVLNLASDDWDVFVEREATRLSFDIQGNFALCMLRTITGSKQQNLVRADIKLADI